MKKFLTFLCVLTCVLGLTACGSTKTLTALESQKVAQCESLSESIVSFTGMVLGDYTPSQYSDMYNKLESTAIVSSNLGIEAELGAFEGILTTYYQSVELMGGIKETLPSTYEISKDTITITTPLTGYNCDGSIIISFSNDILTKFVSGEVTADTTFAQKMSQAGSNMGKAGLNTLLGMGTVFIMLILISFIISAFKLFSKIGNKKTVEAPKAVEAPVVEEEELSDDTELVAVIMAAISAYEGSGSTDGFVVRSIKRANRRF